MANRKIRPGGGVAILSKDEHHVTKVASYTSVTLSTLWLKFQQPKSPSVIVAVIYHPPNRTKEQCIHTIDHIFDTINSLAVKSRNTRFLITGDFNRLDMSSIADTHNLNQLVNFNTRENARLDGIYTNIPE